MKNSTISPLENKRFLVGYEPNWYEVILKQAENEWRNINAQLEQKIAELTRELEEANNRLLILKPSHDVHGVASATSGSKAKFCFSDIITNDPQMKQAVDAAVSAAQNMGNVLISGESGTGKELIAQSIHNGSSRRQGPFIGINCGAIPRELIASELFGYADGAFTGSRRGGKPGKFELANGGTIFLDEIGDMPLEQQVVLLRVIQEKTLTRIGGNRPIPIDCRIICATNKDLLREIENNNFRRDLYYRLNVINLHMPSLRERVDDIPLLIQHYSNKLAASLKCQPLELPDSFLPYLRAYYWPGNVRELQNVVERLFYLAKDRELTLANLPAEISHCSQFPHMTGENVTVYDTITISEQYAKQKAIRETDQRKQILEVYNGNISRVSKELGIARSTLYARMKRLHI